MSSDTVATELPTVVAARDGGEELVLTRYPTPSAALRAALAAREAGPGLAFEVEGSPSLAALARLASPGQVLTSATAWRSARAPSSLAWGVDHGVWLVEDVGLVGVMEVLPPGSVPGPRPSSVSGARRLGASRNLPLARTSFHGRDAELRRVEALLRGGAPVVTVTGPGGMGKSRLATEVAARMAEEFPGGVFVVELAEVWGHDAVTLAVAGSIEAPTGGADPLADVLPARGRTLLVVNNAETALADVAAFATRCRKQAPEVQLLVTSRASLGVPEERIVDLEPLPLEAGVELFVARARMANPAFAPKGRELDELRELVADLDAMPLALELAAARMRVFTPRTLRERLEQRFQMLRGPRGAPWRQGTLGATLDWSWVLLQPWEQAALAQLSVFSHGFCAAAAEATVDLSGWPEAPPFAAVLRSLADNSLVRRLPDERFGLLRTVAAYAAERLAQEGAVRASDRSAATGPEAVAAAKRRYVAWYASLATNAPDPAALREEREELVAAGRVALDAGDVGSAVPITLAAAQGFSGSPSPAAAVLVADVLAAHGARDADRTRLLLARTRLL
jgi:predicted ATPase